MAAKGGLKERLGRYRQITITVVGRKSGKPISNPVWFVPEGNKLHLLPVNGSDTQWFKNLLKDQQIRVAARDEQAEFRAKPLSDHKAVAAIAEKFREKYGAGDVKKYYSKFDVAVEVSVD